MAIELQMNENTSGKEEKIITLVVTTLSSFITPFMASALNIALPSIASQFNMNAILLSWVATSYLLSTAVLLVPLGKIADIFGRKKIFLLGISIFTLSTIGCAVAVSSFFLIFSRIIQGIGSAMIFGTAIAILTSVYPPGERGKALGINIATTYTGLSIGPFLGGVLTENFGWRSIFISTVPLGIIIFVLVLFRLKGEWAEAKGESFDFTGSLIFILMYICLMFGFTLLPSFSGILIVLSGLAGLFIFVKWESRIAYPVFNILLFRKNTVFAFSNIAALINYSATSAIAFLLSLYLQYVKGLTPQSAGFVLVSQPVVMALVSPFAGRLSDRIEPRILASLGMGIIVLGLLLLFLIGSSTPVSFISFALVLLGLGFGLFSSPNTNAIMSSVEKRFYGIASATLATMRLSGQMLSMAISIMAFSVLIGNVHINPSNFELFIYSIKILFAVFAALCFAGVFASLARGKMR
ncbi:MAG: MFS transporter [Bacteroidota bacterium]|nr:MFS transporter [Bacteroidota bacterium]MDP4195415.1 MFS transporter [Bacteroidota bacterium]